MSLKMYTLFATPRKITTIRKILSRHRHLLVRETKFPEYLFVDEDPRLYLSPEMLAGVKIEIAEKGFTDFYKEAGRIGELIEKLERFKKPKPINPGDMVRIKEGRFAGFSGLVKSVSEKGDYEVQVSVWGNIMKSICKREELEKVEVEF